MAKEIRLPQLGQTMEEGTVVSCLATVGDEVKKGDVIFEVETDKATLEMESPADGFVKIIIVKEGDTIPVNDVMMIVGGKDEEVSVEALAAKEQSDAPSAQQEAATGDSADLSADAKVVNLPQLGQTMEEGTIVSCLVKLGDEVKKGDVIFEVETDKATLEMESPAEGLVKAILVKEGDTIPVNDAMMVLGEEGIEVTDAMLASLGGAPAGRTQTAESKTEAEPKVKAQVVVEKAVKREGRVIASPRAKFKAKEIGVGLAEVKGSGPGGRVVEADVLAAAGSAAAAEPEFKLGQKVMLNRLGKITAEKMLQSKRQIPCFYLNVTVDATELVAYRAKLNKAGNVKLSFNDFIMRAMAVGLKMYPIMTGQLEGDYVQLADSIGIGLAISTDEGLVAPIVKDVDKKTVQDTAEYSSALIERAKGGKLSPDDLAGGSITLSNLGAFGIDSFIPIVVPGQCSILGVGKISDTCVPTDGNLLVRKMMKMTLSVDHRVANGAEAAQFLNFVVKQLESPSEL